VWHDGRTGYSQEIEDEVNFKHVFLSFPSSEPCMDDWYSSMRSLIACLAKQLSWKMHMLEDMLIVISSVTVSLSFLAAPAPSPLTPFIHHPGSFNFRGGKK